MCVTDPRATSLKRLLQNILDVFLPYVDIGDARDCTPNDNILAEFRNHSSTLVTRYDRSIIRYDKSHKNGHRVIILMDA